MSSGENQIPSHKRLTRAIILRYALKGYSWREIAEAIGCSKYLIYQLKKEYRFTDKELCKMKLARAKLASRKAGRERKKYD